jgi:predicted nucleic acid-binding protein
VLVVDAAIVVTACLAESGFDPLAKEELIAPHLMWSEVSSVLHELKWRREISTDLATVAMERLAVADVSPRRPKGLTAEAWRIADRFGWAKTYDAEYLALARLLRCRLLTTDAKLKRVAGTMLNVVGPTDL